MVKGRVKVKKVLSHCLVCQWHEGPLFRLPKMPPWPRARVKQSLPFQFIGLDYLGPVLVREGTEVIKAWICFSHAWLFVLYIGNGWGIWLWINSSLVGEDTYIAQRGKPQLISSDNALQFKVENTAVDRQWKQVMLNEEVRHYITEGVIKWQFTTTIAPWQGGIYEQLVALVKHLLQKSFGQLL